MDPELRGRAVHCEACCCDISRALARVRRVMEYVVLTQSRMQVAKLRLLYLCDSSLIPKHSMGCITTHLDH